MMPSPRSAHRISLLFALAVLVLTIVSVMQPSPPVCGGLAGNYAPIIAFELARSVSDLHAIFGDAPGACRTAIAARMDLINTIDSFLFIPLYGAFLVFFFLALRSKNEPVARIAAAITILACLADYVENYALFHLSADPDRTTWIPVLIGATETKWVGLAFAAMLAVPLLRNGWLRWLAALLCGAGLVAALASIPAAGLVGPYLSNAIALGWILFLAIDVRESLRPSITRAEA
jgi:hypothetical protein